MAAGRLVQATVRWARPGEAEALRSLVHSAWLLGHGHLFGPAELDLLKTTDIPQPFTTSWSVPDSGVIFVADADGASVGVLNLRPNPSDGSYGLVEPLMVSPTYNRRGVGTNLWNACANFSEQRGDRGLTVWALNGNPIANNFYLKMGGRPGDTGSFKLGRHVEPATQYLFHHPQARESAPRVAF